MGRLSGLCLSPYSSDRLQSERASGYRLAFIRKLLHQASVHVSPKISRNNDSCLPRAFLLCVIERRCQSCSRRARNVSINWHNEALG